MPEKGSQQTQPAPPPPSTGLGRGFPDLGLSLGAGGDQAMFKWLQHQAVTQRSSGGGVAVVGTTPVVGAGATGTVIVTVGGGGGNATTVTSHVDPMDAATAAANVAFGVPRKPSCDSPLPGGGGVGSVTGPGGPLAALHAAAAARGLFGVNRINPLFLEDPSPPDSPPPPPPSAAGGKRRGEASEDSGSGSDGCGGDKSGSSGYGEHSSSDGGCASSSGGEEEAPPKGNGAGLSVLRRDSAFVSSICIPPPNSPGALLSPIPEGVGADAVVPRPVWPRSTASSSSSSTSSRSGDHDGGGGGGGESTAEEALRRLSLTLSGSRHVERVTRALSHKGGCSSSSGAGTASSGACSSGSSLRTSPSSGSAASSREGSLRGGVGCVGCPGSSSSGFSELSPPGSARRATPPTCPHAPLGPVTHQGDGGVGVGNGTHSAAQVAAAALLLQLLPPADLPSLPPPQLPPALVQLTAPHATSPAALRNAAFVYGTLRRPKGYERMGPSLVDATPSPLPPRTTIPLPLTATDIQRQGSSKRDGLYSFGCGLRGGAPDFTLDVARAERLLRKIREAKQRRCACRLLTCALALAVFLAAVVAVSMVVTRGQRVFGPI